MAVESAGNKGGAETVRELTLLLDYLVKHNAEHAGEIRELAGRAMDLGETQAHEHLVRGVELLEQANESLKAALTELRG